MSNDIEELLRKEEELREQLRLKEELPHLFGYKWYAWAKRFFDNTDTYCLLTAANQVSKSSTQIRKCIDWATDTSKWSKLWRTTPRQFWYLYPTKEVAWSEFETKWIPEFMPRGKMKDHAQYGWKPSAKGFYIQFNSGVRVVFKGYSQDVSNLQTASAHAIFSDEELPVEIFPEVNMRIAATNGYFNMVFTATLGQEKWRRAMEEIGKPNEELPTAFKQQVSMYDCLKYTDGTNSHWTVEKIKAIEATLTETEIQRRIYGRFVVSEGLLYPEFSVKSYPEGNYITEGSPEAKIPETWPLYIGVDYGAGGTSHPSAISMVAVDPDFSRARIFASWRGDGITTTAQDLYDKLVEMLPPKVMNRVAEIRYDYVAKDFGTIAEGAGLNVMKADKSRDTGIATLNSLFKTKALLMEDTPENQKYYEESRGLKVGADKTKSTDDLLDSLRYACISIPWDWEKMVKNKVEFFKDARVVEKPRMRGEYHPPPEVDTIDSEIEELNSLCEF